MQAQITDTFQVSTDLFSRDDICFAVATALKVDNVGYISSKQINKGLFQLSYNVWNDASKKWVKCSRFVSVKQILKAKFQRKVDAAKQVLFVGLDALTGDSITSNGHHCNARFCTCPDYSTYRNKFALYVNGYKVCKHTIAYNMHFNAVKTPKQLLQVLAA